VHTKMNRLHGRALHLLRYDAMSLPLQRSRLASLQRTLASEVDAGSSQPSSSAHDVARIVSLMQADRSFCRAVAASVDTPTAEKWAHARSSKEGTSSSSNVDLTSTQLVQLFIYNAVPFVGFGFCDNVIMLTVGETIELTFGETLGLTTLAAAGLGQCASDGFGITLQGIIERFADKLGLPNPRLTAAQRQRSAVKSLMMAARTIGIITGCLLGMFPLLFMRHRQNTIVDQMFKEVTAEKRQELMRHVVTKEFEDGAMILRRGDISTHVFLIQSGEVDVKGRDHDGVPFNVCTIGPGHAFGKPHLHQPCFVDLVAKGCVVLQAIEKDSFLRIMDETKHVQELFESVLSKAHEVYYKCQQNVELHRAEKGTGKTREFAAYSSEDKLEVLRCTGLKEALKFEGKPNEGKVKFFASLTEEQKRDALLAWYKKRNRLTASEASLKGDVQARE